MMACLDWNMSYQPNKRIGPIIIIVQMKAGHKKWDIKPTINNEIMVKPINSFLICTSLAYFKNAWGKLVEV